MTRIRVEPENLYFASRSLSQGYSIMAEALESLRDEGHNLEWAWQGGSAADFLTKYSVLLEILNQQIEECFNMSRLLSRQADAWSESDQRWAEKLRLLKSQL